MDISALPDDVLASTLAFLDTVDAVGAASRVSTRWRGVLDAHPLLYEPLLFELDPLCVLGPSGVAAALRAGVGGLEMLRLLGDSSSCSQCDVVGGAPLISRDDFTRSCLACARSLYLGNDERDASESSGAVSDGSSFEIC